MHIILGTLFCMFIEGMQSLLYTNRWGQQLEQATYKTRQRLYLSEQASIHDIAHFVAYLRFSPLVFPFYTFVRNVFCVCNKKLILVSRTDYVKTHH